MYKTILSPVNYGGIILKNRIIFAPSTMGLSRDEFLAKLRQIARGGCAMIIIGDVPASPWSTEPSLYKEEDLSYYSQMTDTVHQENCRICAQLYLSDSVAEDGAGGIRLVSKEETGDYVSQLSATQLSRYAAMFGDAAQLAQKAGFDMVQILGDRMLGSLCSTIFNRRKDEYGGDMKSRAHFVQECVGAVRIRLPQLPVDYKLCVRQENPHYGNAGVLQEEVPYYVQVLEKAGVTSFHVTLANHCALGDVIPSAKHPYFGEEGCFLRYSDIVRNCTSLPVCGVGGLTDPDFVEKQLTSGRIDCAAMSRQLIADPEWVNKIRQGRPETIQRCLRCNGRCIQGMIERSSVHCMYEK
ncbi:bilirubin reductase [Flintibacter muris]|uniref:bilirubin reductase n=1 Tax=Flintibacter muris TaxID=2941327 RepID=UPI0020425B6E|nr:bilirubin reductase [Flintibacter muris]